MSQAEDLIKKQLLTGPASGYEPIRKANDTHATDGKFDLSGKASTGKTLMKGHDVTVTGDHPQAGSSGKVRAVGKTHSFVALPAGSREVPNENLTHSEDHEPEAHKENNYQEVGKD